MQEQKNKKQDKEKYYSPALINHGKLNDITAAVTGTD